MERAAHVNGIRLAFERTGSGTPLLLLHGGSGRRQTFEPLRRFLAHDLEVYAVDLREVQLALRIGRDVRVELLSHVRHGLHLDDPKRVADVINAFVRDIAAR